MEEIDSFHTPKSSNVDDLFRRVLDKKDVSASWKWQNMSFPSARKKLDEYVRMRGDIAHRTKYQSKVYKGYGADYLGHIDLLVEKTDESIAEYIGRKIGKGPWK